MHILIAILFASVLTWLLFNWKMVKKSSFSSTVFCGIFILKLFFGISFYLVYTAYYDDRQTSDMHKYYNDAVKIFELTQDHPQSYLSILTGIDIDNQDEAITQQLNFWYQEESASVINDSRMIIRFNLLMLPFSRGNIYLHLVMMVFLSFAGLLLIYKSLEQFFKTKELLLLLSCFGIPSVMFWSSGIMKEGLLLFFFGILIYNLFTKTIRVYKRCIFLILSFAGMFFVKFYVALALVPSLLFIAIHNFYKKKSNTQKLVITCLLIFVASISFNTVLNNLPLEKLSKKQNDFINLSLGGVYLRNTATPFDTIFTLNTNSLTTKGTTIEQKTTQLIPGTIYHHWKNPGYADTLISNKKSPTYTILKILQPTGSAITLKRLMPTYSSVLKLLPEAFINVFFRPFIFDVENLFSLFACIENCALLILIVLLIFKFKMPDEEAKHLISFSVLFVFTLYTLVGLTTPVLGAAVRYKVPALPFLLISIFLFYDYAGLQHRFRFQLSKKQSVNEPEKGH